MVNMLVETYLWPDDGIIVLKQSQRTIIFTYVLSYCVDRKCNVGESNVCTMHMWRAACWFLGAHELFQHVMLHLACYCSHPKEVGPITDICSSLDPQWMDFVGLLWNEWWVSSTFSSDALLRRIPA